MGANHRYLGQVKSPLHAHVPALVRLGTGHSLPVPTCVPNRLQTRSPRAPVPSKTLVPVGDGAGLRGRPRASAGF